MANSPLLHFEGERHLFMKCPVAKNFSQEDYIATWDTYLTRVQLNKEREWDNVLRMQRKNEDAREQSTHYTPLHTSPRPDE